MSGKNKSRRWKLAIKIALGCILTMDVALMVVSWQAAGEQPQVQKTERDRLAARAKLLSADVEKGKKIEKDLPDVGKECDSFYQSNLLPESSGYSTLVADLGQMAKNAGVQTSGVSFKEQTVKDRGLNEVTITAAVQGDYQGLVRLINELEHSSHFYVLDGLTLASESSGTIKLQVALRTYLRR
ncbi:MAG TPA: type 4a pilus biogenesis protein PilO [Candidatus Acidoferrales bacterium]|nr:type 4a pilus biogenesis protein PilO [Candidatus Acidoferrales bacterium]